jgi:hypothetical protein
MICFDLSATLQKQQDQIKYWLDFLQSTLPLNPNEKAMLKVVLVGLKAELKGEYCVGQSTLLYLREHWPLLPLYEEIFEVSSFKDQSILISTNI